MLHDQQVDGTVNVKMLLLDPQTMIYVWCIASKFLQWGVWGLPAVEYTCYNMNWKWWSKELDQVVQIAEDFAVHKAQIMLIRQVCKLQQKQRRH